MNVQVTFLWRPHLLSPQPGGISFLPETELRNPERGQDAQSFYLNSLPWAGNKTTVTIKKLTISITTLNLQFPSKRFELKQNTRQE